MTQKDQIWYSNALERLQPLRYHIHELLIELEILEKFAKRMGYALPIPARAIKEAKKARNKAEKFFTGK